MSRTKATDISKSPVPKTGATAKRTVVHSVCPTYNRDDADVEIIASNNMLFKVHSYRLQSASSVFRSMIGMAQSSEQRNPIILTDENMECAIVVEIALDIIYTYEADFNTDYAPDMYMYTVDFARKWDIPMIPSLITKQLQLQLAQRSSDESTDDFYFFLLSLELKNNALASAFLKTKEKWESYDSSEDEPRTWTEGDDDYLPLTYSNDSIHKGLWDSETLHGGALFDLGAMPYLHFLTIPPNTLFAIVRAQHLSAHDKKPVSEHFKALMDIAYPPEPIDTKRDKKRKAGE